MNQLQLLQVQLTDLPVLPSQEEMESLVANYLAARGVIEGLVEQQAQVKTRVRQIIQETGITEWNTLSGNVIVPADGIIVSYDAHALDALSESNRAFGRNARPHRREYLRPGGIRISPYER